MSRREELASFSSLLSSWFFSDVFRFCAGGSEALLRPTAGKASLVRVIASEVARKYLLRVAVYFWLFPGRRCLWSEVSDG